MSVDGWLLCTKLLYFIWNIPKPSAIRSNLPSVQDVESLALTLAGVGVAVFIFFLKPTHLITFYLAIASLGVIGWSYVLNVEYVKYCSDLLRKHSKRRDFYSSGKIPRTHRWKAAALEMTLSCSSSHSNCEKLVSKETVVALKEFNLN
ncbi:hypothetical protein JTE90_021521 [Oedothorax gibbosus]|uniref:TRC8-like N-terminal domain-containing protein n=1 Tax=Oedothorax gibbosus TaxID=931172 RepID=A0AAV6VR90_9ARAC|nr:hypothetical protein JTE90_021521 [Oedothorax gibbosus]